MKTKATTLLALALAIALGPRSAHAVFLSTNVPNVMILLDTSGSMTESILSLPPYSANTNYPAAGYTAATVYNKTAFSGYVVYAANVAAVTDAAARASLNLHGFWFGAIGGEQVQLFTGNYLNYQGCTSCKVNQSKISIAKNVINTIVQTVSTARFGVMRFINNNSQNPPGGGGVVAPIGSTAQSIQTAVNAINATGFTPTGEQLRDSGLYFRGQLGHPSPIQSGCQVNTSLVISDGLWNGVINPANQATTEYTTDHAANLPGTQNLVVNTVGFDVQSQQQGIVSLQNTATNGGGSFFLANDLPALQQSLFYTFASNGVSMTAPAPYAILSGVTAVSAGVPNSVCISSVQFFVDGNISLGVDTVAPYTLNWNTAGVLNGTHTLTAVAWDIGGNSMTSIGVPVTTSNDQTPPVISGLNVVPTQTGATISWSTNEPADTQVYYGLTAQFGSTSTLNPALTLTHEVPLSGLTPNTQYFYKVLSRDAASNLAELGTLTFNTLAAQGGGGPLDHFTIKFLSGAQLLPGPGTPAGNRPYAVFAGDCFSTTIEAVDAAGLHVDYNGSITVAQYYLNSSGVETELAPGIALRSQGFNQSVSSFTRTMVNGFAFLGSGSDVTNQLCFYRAKRSPGDYGQTGTLGDMHVKVIQTGTPSVNGISSSYVGWHGSPSRLAMIAPGQSLAPATFAGVVDDSGITDQYQGRPFPVSAYLTDAYWNPVLNVSDNLHFTSSLPGLTGFVPFSASLSGGVVTTTATVNACNTNVTLSVEDTTSSLIPQGQAVIEMLPCGSVPPGMNAGFYQLSLTGLNNGLATAGEPFNLWVTVKNVNIPAGGGSAFYAVRFAALKSADGIHFGPGSGDLSVSYFEFAIPAGTTGDYTIPNPIPQVYTKAETIWIQLSAAEFPAELLGATAMSAPIPVAPGQATSLRAAFNPPTIAPLSAAQLIVTLTDVYGNGIPDRPINAAISQGAGGFSGQTQLLTNALGQAVFGFTSGTNSGATVVNVQATSTVLPPVAATLLTSLLGDKTVAAYPNPRKITDGPINFEYRLAQNSDVTLTITDLFGRQVWKKTYSGGQMGGAPGFNKVAWDGRNSLGATVAVGIYALHGEVNANGQRTSFKTKFGIRK